MKTSFRIVSIIVSVCIILSALPLVFSAMATETEPALPSKCETIISQEGVNGDFGAKYNDLASETKITLSPTIDLSQADKFELDVYIEDADVLKSAIENSPGNGEQGLNLYFGSATLAVLYASNNIAGISIAEQITNDGWNHIVVSKTDFTENSINWAKVKYVFLKFNDNITNQHTDLANTSVKLRNICTVISLPEIKEGSTVIYNDLIKATLGENENSLYSDIKNRFVVSDLEAVDISNNSHIGIDIKVSDFDKFNSLINNENISTNLVLTTETGNFSVELKALREGAISGWYNITAPINNTVSENVTGFYFDIAHSKASEKIGEAYSLELCIANVYATDMSTITANTVYGDVVTDFNATEIEFKTGKYYKDFLLTNNGDFTAIADSENIEFDLFIEDYETFKNSFKKDLDKNDISVEMQFLISNVDDFNGQILSWTNIQDKIVYGGWNHIILPISDATNNGFNNSQSVKAYKLEIVGVNKENKTSYKEKIAIIDRLCATKYQTPTVTNQYDKITDFSANGKQWKMGATFVNSAVSEYTTSADFSSSMFIEFDIYVQNYEAWSKTMADGNSTGFSMVISSAEEGKDPYSNDSRIANFKDYITHNGWNHICVPFGNFKKVNSSGLLDESKVSYYKVYYNGNTAASTNNLKGQFMAIANIGGTTIKVPDEYSGNMGIIAELNSPAKSATYTTNYKMTMTDSLEEAIDFSKASFVEFDIYIEDYENFVESFKTDANGKEVGVALCFGIGMTKNYNDKNGYLQWSSIQNQVKQSGWNHIMLALGGPDRSNSAPNGIKTIENIQCWKLWYSGDAYKNGEYVNRVGDDLLIIANIKATGIVDPALPDNVLSQIGTSKTSTLGKYFHYTGDRFAEEKLEKVDFSKGTAIEFDIYIDDYEALLAAEEASANNWSGLPYARNSKLALYLSSTPAGLWGQYSHPRNYYNGYITISDKITHSGWNHIRVGRSDFIAANQTIDWSNINAWNLKFVQGSNVHPELNPYPNITVRICNIVSTGIIADIPKDTDKDAKPDKTAVYISDAETLSDDTGSWNPSSAYISNDYKSEGKASIALDLNYKSLPEEANIYYLFDDSADMSDLKTLKFDFFIDLPQIIKVAGNKAEIVIANHRNAKDDLYKWELDFSKLSTGWNSFELDINNASKIGNSNLKEAKVILLRFTELNIDAKNFVEIVIGLDNLRYISTTGSTTLKINKKSFNDLPEDTIIEDTDFEIENEFLTEESTDKETIIITSEPETKYIKTIKKVIHQDYLTAGIILGIETAVLIVGAIIFMLIYRKKRNRF